MIFFIFTQILVVYSVANSGDPYQTSHSVASDLDQHCLAMSHKKDARFMWVDRSTIFKLWY